MTAQGRQQIRFHTYLLLSIYFLRLNNMNVVTQAPNLRLKLFDDDKMSRGRSSSPRLSKDVDMDVDPRSPQDKPDAKVIVITNLTRNVVEAHLRTVFSFYGQITKMDVPIFGKSGQNRGKAALEFSDPSAARKAVSHMDGGQLDGAVLKVELSDLPIRSTSSALARLRQTTDAVEEVVVSATGIVIPSEEEVSDVEEGLQDGTTIDQAARVRVQGLAHPSDVAKEVLLRGDALQVTQEEAMGVAGRGVIPFARVGLAGLELQSKWHSLEVAQQD
ncbi:unnamed protein product [Cyclocybe aegerita]|uniref:RRM domain-containing protein n=1 Tax=Cyclocybe aegerita TaxID=1973307 RepID=A0A8S0VTF4_CYCAE|nr:unnamed protein product [Cyclocybe aegerita]